MEKFGVSVHSRATTAGRAVHAFLHVQTEAPVHERTVSAFLVQKRASTGPGPASVSLPIAGRRAATIADGRARAVHGVKDGLQRLDASAISCSEKSEPSTPASTASAFRSAVGATATPRRRSPSRAVRVPIGGTDVLRGGRRRPGRRRRRGDSLRRRPHPNPTRCDSFRRGARRAPQILGAEARVSTGLVRPRDAGDRVKRLHRPVERGNVPQRLNNHVEETIVFPLEVTKTRAGSRGAGGAARERPTRACAVARTLWTFGLAHRRFQRRVEFVDGEPALVHGRRGRRRFREGRGSQRGPSALVRRGSQRTELARRARHPRVSPPSPPPSSPAPSPPPAAPSPRAPPSQHPPPVPSRRAEQDPARGRVSAHHDSARAGPAPADSGLPGRHAESRRTSPPRGTRWEGRLGTPSRGGESGTRTEAAWGARTARREPRGAARPAPRRRRRRRRPSLRPAPAGRSPRARARRRDGEIGCVAVDATGPSRRAGLKSVARALSFAVAPTPPPTASIRRRRLSPPPRVAPRQSPPSPPPPPRVEAPRIVRTSRFPPRRWHFDVVPLPSPPPPRNRGDALLEALARASIAAFSAAASRARRASFAASDARFAASIISSSSASRTLASSSSCARRLANSASASASASALCRERRRPRARAPPGTPREVAPPRARLPPPPWPPLARVLGDVWRVVAPRRVWPWPFPPSRASPPPRDPPRREVVPAR